MTFERRIANQGLSPLTGFKPEPSGDRETGTARILGGQVKPNDRGHESKGQRIHHLLELRNHLTTSKYATDGAISPGQFGAYIFRADGGLTVSLDKSPAVPAEQRLPDDTARHRVWRVTALIFSASEGDVSWPSDVKWNDAPPANPRPAGTADLFELYYMERTGEWWASTLAAGVASADPLTPDPDPTNPEEPETPGDGPGDDETPDNDYTDPETGEVMTPETPDALDGNLAALHENAVAISTDCGSSWVRFGGVSNLVAFAALENEGIVACDASGIVRRLTADGWQRVSIPTQAVAQIEVPNGDFESGELAPWQTISGMNPQVLDTVQPPQQGGRFYLTSDLAASTPFEVWQELDLGSNVSGGVRVSVDAYAGAGSTAELEVRAGWDGETYTFGDVQIRPGDPVGVNQYSDSLALLKATGPTDLLGQPREFDAQFKYDTTYNVIEEILNLKFDDTGGVGSWRVNISETQNFTGGTTAAKSQGLYFTFPSLSFKAETTITLTNASRPGQEILLTFPAGWKCPVGLRYNYVYLFRLESRCEEINGVPLTGAYVVEEAGVLETVSTSGAGAWETLTIDLQSVPPGPFEIVLRGLDNALTWFDNVRASQSINRAAGVASVASDAELRRYFLFTEDAVYVLKDGAVQYVAPLPFAPEISAAHGARVVIANASDLAVSNDGGLTWTQQPAEAGVVQVFARGDSLAVLNDGRIYRVASGGLTLLGTRAAGSWLAYDTRTRAWVATTPEGAVTRSSDFVSWEILPSMPISTDAPDRRILAADVGRMIGWAEASRDLFHANLGEEWSLSKPLISPILDFIEIR